MTILIQIISSTVCRGWEGNTCEFEEYEGESVEDYVREIVKEDWTDEEGNVDQEGMETHLEMYDFSEDGTVHFEGEESCVTYVDWVTSKKELEMFKRHLKK